MECRFACFGRSRHRATVTVPRCLSSGGEGRGGGRVSGCPRSMGREISPALFLASLFFSSHFLFLVECWKACPPTFRPRLFPSPTFESGEYCQQRKRKPDGSRSKRQRRELDRAHWGGFRCRVGCSSRGEVSDNEVNTQKKERG